MASPERNLLDLLRLAEGQRDAPGPHGAVREQGRHPEARGHRRRRRAGALLDLASGVLDPLPSSLSAWELGESVLGLGGGG